jgi:hypothetical protein
MANQLLYGFVQLKDLALRRVTEIGVQVVNDAIDQAVQEHLRQIGAITEVFATPTTDFKVLFTTPTVARLQPLDDNGRARPIKTAGFYNVAYPLQQGGAAWGANYRAREKMTVQEANDLTATLLSADVRWIRDHIMAALFANASWSFPDEIHGSLTIEGLANGDSVKYLVSNGSDQGATDTHYLAQAAAIADAANPFPAIYAELTEHPENDGEVVVFIPTNLKSTVQALATFYDVRDPNIQEGSGVSVLSGSLGIALPGGPRSLLGYADKCWIVEWKSLPDNYMVAITTGGARPLKMREEDVDSLRGFKKVAQRDDHPFYESQWLRIAGFGAFNRVGAVVYRIGNASYAVPTNYGVPMP